MTRSRALGEAIAKCARPDKTELDLSKLGLTDDTAELTVAELTALEHVERVSLNTNPISAVPAWVAELPNLVELSLNNTEVEDLPEWLSDLPALRTLNLTQAAIHQVPSIIEKLAGLEVLNLATTSIRTIPDWLGDLSQLESLNLTATQISTLPASLSKLSKLEFLSISFCTRLVVPDLGRLGALEGINLGGLDLIDVPAWLAELPQLEMLSIPHNRLSKFPVSLSAAPALVSLDLGSNRIDRVPTEVMVGLGRLKRLGLAGNALESLPEELGNLTALRELELDSNRLHSLPAGIERCQALQKVSLSGNMSIALPDALGRLPRLKHLDLSDCGLKSVPRWLRTMRNLEELWLTGNPVKEIPAWIDEVSALVSLNVRSTRISELPPRLLGLRRLRRLDLSDTKVAEPPAWLADMPSLKSLGFSLPRATRLPDWLRGMPKLRQLFVDGPKLTSVPEWIGELRALDYLAIVDGRLTTVPALLGHLGSLRNLDLSGNRISELPTALGALVELRELNLARNQLKTVPAELANLRMVNDLDLSENKLRVLPDFVGQLPYLTKLDLSANKLRELPSWIGKLRQLEDLWLSDNPIKELPADITGLARLGQLDLMNAKIATLPDDLSTMYRLESVDLDGNGLTVVPPVITKLAALRRLDLQNNNLSAVPDGLAELTALESLMIQNNRITSLPPSLGRLERLDELLIEGNPLPPELMAAADEGTAELIDFVRAIGREGELIRESKLVIVGEGGVGKSTLLAAMCAEEFQADRPTTHGIEIKRVSVLHEDASIAINAWDFGGQQIYRPTHQLFFSAPAVYIVAWKPREGPELGLVEHWLTMIKHRAGNAARVHVVATHGGPGQRYAHIDETALRQRFGEMIAGFHHVDSESNLGIADLMSAIAVTAAGLEHTTRWYPRTWLQVRERLSGLNDPYLRYDKYQAIAESFDLSPTSARSLAINAHALGYWIHYADEPALAEYVVLKADWLSVAIGFVLDDPAAVSGGGLISHRRLGEIWNDPIRPTDHRYAADLQQMFLRLMERFEISYRAPELPGEEPHSLVAQLVPSAEPDLTTAWTNHRPKDPELRQVCRIVERDSSRFADPEGLIFRLIVLFHRHSLGRSNIADSVHWSGGLVLQDRYGTRALVRRVRGGVEVQVRGLNPQGFADRLVQDIRDFVEGFWIGLRTRVLIPCREPCGLDAPGRALFDLDKLYRRLDSGKSTSECPEADCDSELEINSILHGLDLAPSASHTRMAEVVERAVSNAFDVEGRRLLDAQTERVLAAQDTATGRLLARVEALDDATKAAFSRAEQRLNVLVRGLQDEGADGPRLFTMEPLSRTVTKPGITTQRMRLTLWCEHSRLPVHVLEPDRKNAGVYVVDVPRDWWVKAAPLIRATSILLKTVLPVSLAAIELDLSDDQWKAVNEQLALEKEVLEVVASQGEDASTSVVIKDGSATPTLAEGGLLRLLHSTLRQQDITFADLRRVTDYTGQYLWVHRQFVSVYQPHAPVIPQ